MKLPTLLFFIVAIIILFLTACAPSERWFWVWKEQNIYQEIAFPPKSPNEEFSCVYPWDIGELKILARPAGEGQIDYLLRIKNNKPKKFYSCSLKGVK